MSKTRDTDDLDDEYAVYESLAELSRQARERALSRPHDSYVANIHIIGLTRKTEERKSAIEEHFAKVDQALFDQFLVRLVATFERCAFAKLGTALGEARSTVQKHYDRSHPFARAAQHLVRDADDFRSLFNIEKLLATYSQATSQDFRALREHRNYVTHGGRIGTLSRFGKIKEIRDTLHELLQIISKDVAEAD